MDNPEHDAYRRLVLSEFTVKRSEERRPFIRKLAYGCLDRMYSGPQPADLVAAVALPVALATICDLLGVPYEDREFFRSCTHTMTHLDATPDEAAAARGQLQEYLVSLVTVREARPGTAFLSRMSVKHVRSATMTPDILGAMALLLLTAGHDTAANMITLGVLTLLQHPEHLSALRDSDGPALAARTAEELLRYHTIVQRGIRRIALEDVDVNGHLVRAGEGVIAVINAANRAPDRFDQAEDFAPNQDARHPLAFGYGIHQCLGQSLARVQLQEVYRAVARRIPSLRLVVPVEQLSF
ncbi:cytochrome P450 [Streptomyces lydicus]|nr:cytochrome P450 [Streptomyces lydicus]